MQNPVKQVRGLVRFAIGVWEHQVHGAFSRVLPMLLKGIRQAVADRDHTLTGVCLGQSEIASIERSPYMQQASLEIKVRPLKAQ